VLVVMESSLPVFSFVGDFRSRGVEYERRLRHAIINNVLTPDRR
jgi:hypothetical protein